MPNYANIKLVIFRYCGLIPKYNQCQYEYKKPSYTIKIKICNLVTFRQ